MNPSLTPRTLTRVQKTLAELETLPQTEQANYLNRLREEEPSLYSQVDSFHKMAAKARNTHSPETVNYPFVSGGFPVDAEPDSNPNSDPTNPTEDTSVDNLCGEFAAALDRGETPQIEDVLARGEDSVQDELLERLILLEVQSGLSEHVANLEDYVQRFPKKRSVVTEAFLRFQEWSLVQADDTTRLGEWPDQEQGTFRVRPEEIVAPKVVFGEYEILSEIARGGMGIVFEARQKSLNRRVALKMIRNGALADKEEVLRFRAEAEAAARLNHPQIVPVYEVGEHDGQHYFTMALIEGESLSVHLRKGPLAPQEAARLLRLVASGVQFAHDRGVVHRDLKPGNILLDADNQPKVADFGLAKQLGQDSNLTLTGCVLGTPSFMPPEQAHGEEAGPRSDIYSLGAILYTMLTNRPPFQAANSAETIQQVKEKDPVPPRQLNPAINQDLQTICLKCLEKNPIRRYDSAQELADELDRFLAGRPILARPVGSLERGWRWCVRHPAIAALLLVSFLAILALGFGFYFRQESLAASELAEVKEQEALANAQLAQERKKLADTQRYYSLISQVREGVATKPLGWTWEAERALSEAIGLDVDSKDSEEFRSLSVAVASHVDLRQVARFTEIEPGQLAINPQGTHLAITTLKGVPEARVFVYDLRHTDFESPSPHEARVYSFSTLADNLGRFLGGETKRFQERITTLAFGPQGRWLVAGTRHGKIHAWDLQSPGTPKKSWAGHPGEVRQVLFSADGEFLYSTSAKLNAGTKCWRVSKEFPLHATLPKNAMALGLTHDDRRLILADDDSLIAYDASTLTSPITISTTDVSYERLAASPVTNLMAGFIAKNEVTLFDPRDGQRVASLIDPYADDVDISELRFTKGGLVFAACEDDSVRIWEAASGKLIASLGAGGRYHPQIAASQDGRWLGITHSGSTQLYEVRLPAVQHVTGLSAGEIYDVEFSKDHQLKTLTEKQKTEANQLAGTWLETWDLTKGRRTRHHPLGLSQRAFGRAFHRPSTDGRIARSLEASRDGAREAVLFSPIGPALLEGDGTNRSLLPRPIPSRFQEWQDVGFKTPAGEILPQIPDNRATDGKAVKRKTGESLSFRIPPTKNQIVFLSIRVEPQPNASPMAPLLETWFRHNGNQTSSGTLHRIDLPAPSNGESYFLLTHCHFSGADVDLGLTVGPAAQSVWVDRIITAKNYDSATTPLQSVCTSPLRTLTLSPDGTSLWALGDAENLVGWKAPDWKVAYVQSETLASWIKGAGGFTTIEAGNRWLLIGHRRGEVSVHDPNDSTLRLEGKTNAFHGVIEDVALHPSEQLAAVGTNRGELKLLRLPGCTTKQVLDPHRLAVRALEFRSDGQWLASGSRDQTVLLWKLTEAGYEKFLTLGPFSSAVERVRFSKDGRWLAIYIQGERGVRVWDFQKLQREDAF